MEVFLTGATGYIGSVVAEKLQAAGHQVIGLVRTDESAIKLSLRQIEPRVGDLRDLEGLMQAARQADGVIHTAFNIARVPAQFALSQETDRRATEAFVTALEGSTKPFVYTSASMLTAIPADEGKATVRIADEEAPIEPPSFLKERFETEQFVLAAASRGVRTIVLRVPEVYGRGSGIHLTEPFKLARQMGVALYVGKGEHRWSTVHVEDLAELYVLALERASACSLFNASSGEVIMKAQAESINRNLGFDGQTRSVTVEEMLEIGGPIYAATYATNCRILGDKAKRLLGWMPKSPSLLEEIECGSYTTGAQTK